MKAKELASMVTGELKDKLQELYVALQKDRAQAATGTPPKNTKSIRNNKKTIARILTIFNSRKEVEEQKK